MKTIYWVGWMHEFVAPEGATNIRMISVGNRHLDDGGRAGDKTPQYRQTIACDVGDDFPAGPGEDVYVYAIPYWGLFDPD